MTNDPSAKDRNTVERHDHEDQHPKHSWRTQWRICTEGWSQWQLTCKTHLDLDSWLTFLFTMKGWYQAVFAWNQRDLSAKRLKPISFQGLKKLQRNLQRFLPILLDKHGQTALWHCSLAGWSLWIFWRGSYTSLQPSWLALIPSVYYLRCAIGGSSLDFTLQQHLVPVGVKTHLSLRGLMHFIALWCMKHIKFPLLQSWRSKPGTRK